jgi:hypothetical protein
MPMRCCGNEKKEKVMLTKEEQDQVIQMVKKMISHDRQMVTRLKKSLLTERGAREWEERNFENLRDLLKEVG